MVIRGYNGHLCFVLQRCPLYLMKLFSYKLPLNIMKDERSNLTDAELVAMIKAGKIEAFGDIFFRYQTKIFSFLCGLVQNRHTAEDLAQNAFLNCYKSIAKWQATGSFKNWLYKIAYREALGYFKKQKHNLEVFTDEGEVPEVVDDRDDLLVGLANKETVEKALQGLPEMYRTVLLLRYYNELSYEEIAEAIELPINTVRTRIRRAKLEFSKNIIQ